MIFMRIIFAILILIFSTIPIFSEENKEVDNRTFLEDSLNIHYFMWAGRILYVRNKDSKIFDTSAKKWGKNIINPEWNDGDGFLTNYVYL